MSASLRAAEIHSRIDWPAVLEQLGIDAAHLRNKHGPCPACGGKDRYRFDNKRGRGDFYCNGCGAGDGFALLMRVHRWSFAEARRRVLGTSRLDADRAPCIRAAPSAATPAAPTSRVRVLLRSACAVADCPDALAYLEHRGLWPLPPGCTLRAHVGLEYWQDGHAIGRFPALVAPVTDLHGELVTVHLTYLRDGRKLTDHDPRKLLSPLTGRSGCAVRLFPHGDALGIAEGIETALAAHKQHGVPTWAALNTSLIQKFMPPDQVRRLVIFADRDAPGLEAAARLMQSLQNRGVSFELLLPPSPHKDWNDAQRSQAIA